MAHDQEWIHRTNNLLALCIVQGDLADELDVGELRASLKVLKERALETSAWLRASQPARSQDSPPSVSRA